MTMRGTITALAYTLFLTGQANAAISPATSNCVDQNFTDAIVYEPTGGQYGICIFSNTTSCEEWTFLRGQCDTSHLNFDSFCSENGGQVTQEDVDWGEVEGAPAAQYGVCTVDDVMCTDYEYYALNKCEFATAAAEVDDSCAVKGGTSRVMGTISGSDYTLCFFGNSNACELNKLMSGECDETNPSLISFCAELGGSMSLGGVEPLEYEVCTVGELTCIEEDYYLNGNCAMMKEGESSEAVTPPDNDECLNATVISSGFVDYSSSVAGATLDEWSIDPNCSFLQVPPGEGVWYVIKGIEAGRNLRVTCSDMDCTLMTTNSTLGECPSMFLCADASVGRTDDNALRYEFTTEEEGIYYIYIAPKQEFPGPEFYLSVERLTPPPTPAPTELLTSPPVSAADCGRGLGAALFNVAIFAAAYFLA